MQFICFLGLRPGYRPPFGELGGLRAPGASYLGQLMGQHGLASHEALQRQLLFERERGMMAGSPLLPGLASQHLQQRQHEEYIRLFYG